MNGFLDENNVVQDFPSLDETSLIFGALILGRILFSLEAIILVMILYPVLHKEIGLKRLKVLAPFSFGTRARKEELVLPPSLFTN